MIWVPKKSSACQTLISSVLGLSQEVGRRVLSKPLGPQGNDGGRMTLTGPPSTRARKPETECGFNYLSVSRPYYFTLQLNMELNVFSRMKPF